MIPPPDYRPGAYDDDWADSPPSGPIPQWGGGVALPLFLVGYGIMCMIGQHAVFSGDGTSLRMNGAKAVAFGIVVVSLGLFLHFHYFWGNVERLAGWAALGKIITLVAFIGSIGYVIARVGFIG